jgi:hypothetical protein
MEYIQHNQLQQHPRLTITGPIIGDTNILATITTTELMTNPTPAKILAIANNET